MTQRSLVLTAVVLATIAVAGSSTVQADDRPNIILLMGDDHGWDETGYNGHPHLHTPVLDEMAATGLRMDRFYSAHPSCSPTRGSVMTGRHPNRYGTFSPNHSIRPEEITIAHLLSDAGYACGHFGKWHLGPVKKESPTNPGAMGFDEWLSHDNFFEIDPTMSRNGGPPEKLKGESSELIIEETIHFIDQSRQAHKPFLAVVWYGSPHEPYVGLEKDLALYDDLPQEYADIQTKLTSLETGRATRRPLRDVLRERYAEITAMDRSIGQLRTWLSEHDLRDNTILWYCGDNGTPGDGIITSPLRGRKGNIYGGGIRVPGIIEWPARIREPQTSDLNSVTSDMLPTICHLTGCPLPDRPLDGINLVPLLEGNVSERPEPICFWSFDVRGAAARNSQPYIPVQLQTGTTPLVKKMGNVATRTFRNFHHPEISATDYNGSRAILDNQYKLVIDGKRGTSSKELFDVRKDPSEENNLAESHPLITAQLEEKMKTWQSSVLQSLTEANYK